MFCSAEAEEIGAADKGEGGRMVKDRSALMWEGVSMCKGTQSNSGAMACDDTRPHVLVIAVRRDRPCGGGPAAGCSVLVGAGEWSCDGGQWPATGSPPPFSPS